MLEKIGLPAKPSMRGSNWVVDASHCQGCSSQFTFLNRKHHCRRCGGLFCNSCTQQRMVLRGQGDAPVRICDPCKKLEEAARFELRYGHKNRAGKGGGSKVEPKHEDELLNEILGTDGKRPFSSARQSTNGVSDLQRAVSSASCSNLQEEAFTRDGEGDVLGSSSIENEIGSHSPEELRQQALEEKKKYRLLKGEGKSEEALLAFKRGKDLERQAGAVEIALRKSRRKALTSNSSASIQKTTDGPQESGRKIKFEEKDDLAAELRVLGWSDADLQDADRKPAKISLEGELSNLLGENGERKTSGIDKTQVLALKKKALMLKREGKLAEAKEELKRAKVLEKQLEEQELLAGSEDSDDELSALIRSMDDSDDKHDDFSLEYSHDPDINLERLVSVADDIAFDGNFDVTDADMNDPEIAAALQSFGWAEDAGHSDDHVLQSVPRDMEALKQEVLSLKREALNLKRSGNVTEAMAQLKKAKLLEKEIEDLQSQGRSNSQNNIAPSNSMQKSSMSVEVDMKDHDHGLPPKSKLAIQKELLGLKKKALALRREGRFDEAEEELKKGKALESQLEEMENAPKVANAVRENVGRKDRDSKPARKHPDAAEALALGDEEEEEADVTEQDMHDPAMLSVLKNLGWEDDDIASGSMPRKAPKQTDDNSRSKTEVPVRAPRSKAEIQRELLGLKRKAFALRREGKSEEAEEELTKAKALEAQMAEMEAQQKEPVHGSLGGREKRGRVEDDAVLPSSIKQMGLDAEDDPMVDVSDADMRDPQLAKALKDLDWKEDDMTKLLPVSSAILVPETFLPNQDKHPSIAKAGSTTELGWAKQADILPQADGSANLIDLLTGNEWNNPHLSVEKLSNDGISDTNMSASIKEKVGIEDEISSGGAPNRVAEKRERVIPTVEKTLTHNVDPGAGPNAQAVESLSRQEILARKRKAVTLKREGKLAEAREELRQAKLLEKSLEEEHRPDTGHTDVVVSTSDSISAVQESRTNLAPKPMSGRDRFKMQQESLAHKRQALKLRREGRIEESEAEFELAKALETQLEELGGHDSTAGKSKSKAEATDGVAIDDLLDPQLLSALKAIGWQDADIVERAPEKAEAKPTVVENGNMGREKAELEERIKAEKLRALNLKRAGKQGEALDALRRAKQLEKKLNSLA